MSKRFESFLKRNVSKEVEIKLEAYSEPFVIERISPNRAEVLTKMCTDKKGNVDGAKMATKALIECAVNPDFRDAEFQDAMEAVSAEDLIDKLFTMAEYNKLVEAVLGDSTGINEEIEEAKN